MSNTPRTSHPLLAAAQAQKHVTHNEALLQLDALLFTRFLDRDLAAPPASPADGDTYLIHATATGDWTGEDGKIAYAADGIWRFYAPFTGLAAFVVDEAVMLVFNGTAWVDYASILNFANIPLLGINTTADATNKLATKSSALLFDNIGAGVQAKLNKHAATDTASLLYQTNYSGRAEFGLTGDDDLHVKVSPDGASWFEGLRIARGSGLVTLVGDPSSALHCATKQYVDGLAKGFTAGSHRAGQRQALLGRYQYAARHRHGGARRHAGAQHDGADAARHHHRYVVPHGRQRHLERPPFPVGRRGLQPVAAHAPHQRHLRIARRGDGQPGARRLGRRRP
jgi:hypothetical protein